MSLHALMHFLFERAGFNRWSPAMEGKRNQGVLHKYLMNAAEDVMVKGAVGAKAWEKAEDPVFVLEQVTHRARGRGRGRGRGKP